MFPLNKKLVPILDRIEELNLIVNKAYHCTELNLKQLNFIKSLGFNMCSGDTVILTMDNLDYIEKLAERKGLI